MEGWHPSGPPSGGPRRPARGLAVATPDAGGGGAGEWSLLPAARAVPTAVAPRLRFLRAVLVAAASGVSSWGLRSAWCPGRKVSAEGDGRRVGIAGRQGGSVPGLQLGARGPGLGGLSCLLPGGGAGQGACGGRAQREAPA